VTPATLSQVVAYVVLALLVSELFGSITYSRFVAALILGLFGIVMLYTNVKLMILSFVRSAKMRGQPLSDWRWW